MAKTFGQYTGGIQAIQGIEQYGAQNAEMISKAWGGVANTISNTYKTINEQEEQTTVNREQAKGTADNLTAIKKLMDANPDTKNSPLSMSINEMIVKLGTAGEMNNGQLKGVLKSAEVFTSQLPLTMQLQDKAFLAQTTVGIQKALAAQKNRTVKDDTGYDIPVPGFSGGSPDKYQRDLRTFFEQHKQANPKVELDVDKAVRDSIQMTIQGFTNDPDLKKSDPAYQQHLIRGFEALGKVDAEIPQAGGWFGKTEEDVFKAMDEVAAADRLANQSPADIRRGEIAAQALEAQRKAGNLPPTEGTAPAAPSAPTEYKTATQKYEAAKTEVEKSVADATAEEKTYDDKATAFVKTTSGSLTPEQSKHFSWLLKKGEEAKKKKETAQAKLDGLDEDTFTSDVVPVAEQAAQAKNADTTFKNLTEAITLQEELKYLEKQKASLQDPNGYVGILDRADTASMFGGGSGLEQAVNLNPAVQEAIAKLKTGAVSDIAKEHNAKNYYKQFITPRAEDLNNFIRDVRTKQNAPLADGSAMKPENRQDALGMVEGRIAKLKEEIAGRKPKVADATPASVTAESKVRVAEATGVTPEAPKEDPYASGFNYGMTIPGVFKNERPLTYEEEKEGIRKWFEENHAGVVPSTIDAIYKTIRPEAALIIKTLPTGEKLIYNEGKGWSQLTQMAQTKGQTDEEKSDAGLYNFGQIVGNRRIPTEARVNSGIMVNGFFSGGKKRAEEFNQALTDTATLTEHIPQLVDMFGKFGHSFKTLNPEQQGVAMGLLGKIRAAIKVETIGTGPIAIAEHKMLQERLGDPNAWLTFDTHEIAKLQSILNTSKSQLQRLGTGVTVTFRQPTVAGQNPIQQNKLDNRINQPSK